MYVSEKHEFIYFAPTKVASNTLAFICTEYYHAKPTAPENPHLGWPFGPHHSIFLPKKYQNYFKFTSVRNPYIRELSKYNFLKQESWQEVYKFIEKLNFKDYIGWICNSKLSGIAIHDIWKRSLKDLIFNQPIYKNCTKVSVDHVIKVENFKEDFYKLPFVKKNSIIEKLIDLKTNFSIKKVQKEFPADLAEKYYNKFKEDFEFGYSKEVPVYESFSGVNKINFNNREINTNLNLNIKFMTKLC